MSSALLREYVQSAHRVQLGGRPALAAHCRTTISAILENFTRLGQTMSEIPVTCADALASVVAATVQARETHLLSAEAWLADGSRLDPDEVITLTSLALENFDELFRRASLFYPHWNWSIPSEHLLEPRTQQLLASVSEIRRTIWRNYEHLQAMLRSPDQPGWGIIDTELDICRLIDESLSLERRRHSRHYSLANVSFAPATKQTIVADTARVLVALRELIRNAVFSTLFHLPSDDRLFRRGDEEHLVHISVELDSADNSVAVLVRDFGIGMDQRTLELMTFYGFSQSTEETQFGGLGVGSSEALLTMTEHCGSMSVESEVGKGTSICLKFPANPLSDYL